MISKTTSIIALITAILGMIFLIEKHYLFSPNPVTIIIQVMAAGLMLWARITFGIRSFHGAANTTEGKLVTNGPYRYWRHPIYASLIYFVWASVIAHPVLEVVLAALFISIALFSRALLEEQFLYKAYVDYAAYAEKTKRIIPFVF